MKLARGIEAVFFFLLVFVYSVQAQPRVTLAPEERAVVLAQEGTACASKPADKTLRQRLVDKAAGQWTTFGFQVWDIASRLNWAFPGGDVFDLVPPGRNVWQPHTVSRLLTVGVKEDERDVDGAIGSYWATVPGADDFLQRQNKIWGIAPHAGWADAWSAAFISWLMCEAGLTEAQFKRSSWHWEYVDQAIAGHGIYRAVDVRDAGVPEPGDLICADRAKEAPYTRLADRKVGEARPLHCDLVVRRDWPHNRLFAIGGNVLDSVAVTVVRITATGEDFHIEPTRHRNWFAVLKLKAGGTADLGQAPLKKQKN
jgi:hypothetical protein